MPWAMGIARYCLDLFSGKLIAWPRPGGFHEQWEVELDAMDVAWQVFRLYTAKRWADVPGAAELALWLDDESLTDVYDPDYLSRIDL